MKTILYSCPYVPAEWIAAHGLRPSRIVPRLGHEARPEGGGWNINGLCLLVRAWLSEAARRRGDPEVAAIVLTTTCDQMRRGAELIARTTDAPVFLLNVPATWQTIAAQQCYLAELKRLGDSLVGLGGKAPSAEELARVMLDFDEARAALREARGRLSPKEFARALTEFQQAGSAAWRPGERYSDTKSHEEGTESHKEIRNEEDTFKLSDAVGTKTTARRAIPLALVGEALLPHQREIYDLIEAAGGSVDLDASGLGERTLAAPLDRRAVGDDPLLALADAYFGAIPDAMRRPNSALYQWLKIKLVERGIRGIVFRRSLWCDLWNAEAQRMKEWVGVPLLVLDLSDEERPNGHVASRIASFLEMLT